jgi:hypothetical protein
VSKSAAPDKDHQGALMGRSAPPSGTASGSGFRLGSGPHLTKDWPVWTPFGLTCERAPLSDGWRRPMLGG